MTDYYRTTDIILAASLRYHNYPMIDIEVNGTKGTFVFENVDESFIQSYDLGNCQVEPVSFNNTIKQLTTSVRRIVQE